MSFVGVASEKLLTANQTQRVSLDTVYVLALKKKKNGKTIRTEIIDKLFYSVAERRTTCRVYERF